MTTLEIVTRRADTRTGDEDAENGTTDEATGCPVCGSVLEHADATVSDLADAAAFVKAELDNATAAEPARQDALNQLEETADQLRARMRQVHEALSLLAQDREQIRLFHDQETARAYVKGRIVQHLEELAEVGGTAPSELEARVEAIRSTVEDMEERLDPEAEREQVVSRLNVIGDDMTKWAEELALEHTGGRVRLDAYGLTVVADTSDGPVPLERMGSAGNWVGYHLVAHLALHRWFVEQERPVPRFLMIDQPTQAFYPPDVDDGSVEEIGDADREAVAAMFKLMNDVAEQLAPNLQIIVMDHANLEEEWFQDALIEEWRHGTKLVPEAWLA